MKKIFCIVALVALCTGLALAARSRYVSTNTTATVAPEYVRTLTRIIVGVPGIASQVEVLIAGETIGVFETSEKLTLELNQDTKSGFTIITTGDTPAKLTVVYE